VTPLDEGEGAFYGPKIDITIRDSLGRNWQCATFQLDFQLPQRFDLTFTAEDGTKQRPIVIHRAIFGSFERFIGVIIEHLNGKFPTWLAPVQVVVLPVSATTEIYAQKVVDYLKEKAGCRVDLAVEGSLNYRIRHYLNMRVPNILVVGEREMESKTLSIRKGKQSESVDLYAFADDIRNRIANRTFDVEVVPIDQPGARSNPTNEAVMDVIY
jgi:threonyl-tRNA synthetase